MAGEQDNAGSDRRQSRRTIGGAAIMLALLGIALLIFFLGDIVRSFDSRYAVVVVMERVPGLATGNPVWIGGRQVGTVTSVALLPRVPNAGARFAVELDLPESARTQVRADSEVRLTAASLIGEPVVDIWPGTTAAPSLGPGDTLYMPERLTAAELTGRARSVRAELDSALAALRMLAPPFQARLADTRRAFAGMDAALTEARAFAAQVSASPGLALLRDPAFTGSLQRTRSHATEMSETVAALRGRMQRGGEVGDALSRLQLRTDSLRAQLDGIAAILQTEDGFLARYGRDTAITRALNAARADLDSLIAETKRNPLRFLF